MRKFKNIHKPKRKYIKKIPATPYFYLSKSVLVGLIPFLLISLAFFTTVIIKLPSASFSVKPTDLRTPYIIVTQTFRSAYDELIKSTASFNKPPLIVQKPPSFSLPEIDFGPFIQSMSLLEQNIQSALQNATDSIGATVKSIDLKPFFVFSENLAFSTLQGIGINSITFTTSLISVYQISENIVLTVLSDMLRFFSVFIQDFTHTISQLIQQGITVAMQVMTAVVQFVIRIINETVQLVQSLFENIKNALINLSKMTLSAVNIIINSLRIFFIKVINYITFIISSLIKLTISIATTVIIAFISIISSIIHAINSFFYFLGTPFRVLGHYLDQWSPFFTLLGKYIDRAANDLGSNMSDIFGSTKYFQK